MAILKLYVIDDDEIFHFMIKKTLSSLNQDLQLETYNNGKKALKALEKDCLNENTPDIILLDINMPIMDGWEFLKIYERFSSKIKNDIFIYLISSSKDPEDIHKAQEIMHLAGYITKPINKEELTTILKKTPKDYWMVSTA
ncbi:response regulator [Christiangramia fulva]|uniref:Response regulator n=1 Tax=Christiangramia fulva TaxID=2126553 RepID=A0A2R3Z788_9FLAO|nr:response regulator [Christiangramia fulva]AVR46119.1 response regulator [Christiangramia fulva]